MRDTVISFEIEPPTAAEMAARIERITRTHPWLVVEHERQAVGFAYAAPHRERAAYRWATDVSVYVASGHHRRGLGKALYEALFDLLRAQGLLVACAGITLPNPASVGLHESLGFVPVGAYQRIGFKAGAWHDVGWWQLELAPRRPPPARATPARAVRALIQRVTRASVSVAGERVAVIGPGLLVLLGVTTTDGPHDADWLADKVRALRVFGDQEGRMNEPLNDREILCVSQFTLYGDARRGTRPSYVQAARPEHAEPLYERFCARAQAQRGVFGAMMTVELVGDGPVTLMLESPAGEERPAPPR